jgi:hypothetical protein
MDITDRAPVSSFNSKTRFPRIKSWAVWSGALGRGIFTETGDDLEHKEEPSRVQE